MKPSTFVTLFTAALVSGQTELPGPEISAWYGCTNTLIMEYNNYAYGDLPSCNL